MPYINQPPSMQSLFNDLSNRIAKLENAQRFTAPDVPAEPTYPRVGDIIYNNVENYLEYWDGTQWNPLATTINGSIGPETTVNATLKTVNNNITYTGNPCQVTGQQLGNSLTAYAEITGTTVSNWGTGQIYFTLPVGFPTFAHAVVAPGYITVNGVTHTCFGLLAQGASNMYLWYPTSNGQSSEVDHNSPATLNTTTSIILNGVAILA
jgi:hypothetical protein